ncbi:DUF815 domain-containing protein (plasmid) [Acinetobacter baumannii]|nr:DUF815 domain-containing protein [Acinetobacter baumannii]
MAHYSQVQVILLFMQPATVDICYQNLCMRTRQVVTRVDVPQYTELHPQEAIEEKISLSDRFGMWLSFYPMDQNLYLTIVEHYLAKTDMPMNDEAHAEALRWCQARGQRSGRAAYQFSKHWIGSQQLKAL